jgi:hypothetical protein
MERTHSAIETILSNDFPTEVPPNFWTTHGELSSSELLLSNDAVDAVEEGAPVGVEAPERLSCMFVVVEVGISNTLATSRYFLIGMIPGDVYVTGAAPRRRLRDADYWRTGGDVTKARLNLTDRIVIGYGDLALYYAEWKWAESMLSTSVQSR